MVPAIREPKWFQRLPFLPTTRSAVIGVAFTFFATLCVLPVAYMFAVSFLSADGSLTFENYRRLLIEPRQRQLLFTSTLLGAGAAALATVIGAPLGLLLARADLPAKRFLRFAFVVPLVIPPYILALAWIYLGGSAGVSAQVFGRDLFSSWTYSLTGAIVVLGISFYPLSMLATEAAARRVDGRLEEAALLVTHPRLTLSRITLPLIAPSIAAAALIIFVLALSEFGVPGLLRVPVFTTEVFTAFAAFYDFGAATALATPMLILALLAGIAAKRVIGERLLTTRRSTHTGRPFTLARWRAPIVHGLVFLLIVLVALPLVMVAVEAGGVGRVIAAVAHSGEAITNSLLLAAIGTMCIVAIAVLVGYGRARARTRVGTFVDLVFIVIFAVPSTVLGVGLIGLWNRPGFLGEIYTSPLIIVLAYIARFVPVAALILAASLRQVPASFEEAAEIAGASWMRTFFRIVLPQIRTGLAAAGVAVFIFAFGELGATVLVAPPGESTLPVRVYTLIANTPSSEVAALALMQSGIVLISLVLFGAFARYKHRKG